MKKIKYFVIFWLPLIVWMTTIYYFSSLPRFSITEKDLEDFLIFKMLHMFEYGVLYFLMFRISFNLRSKRQNNSFILPFILAVLYAASDEIHQHFVPTREGKTRDVFIDMAGIYISFIYIKANLQFVKKYLI